MAAQGGLEKPKVRRILDAAASVFARRGFSGARMDEVAGEAGVSKGGLYLHFKSKEELFDALVGYVVSLETRKIALAVKGEGPVVNRLVRVLREYAEDMLGMAKLFPFFVEVYARAYRSETLRRLIQGWIESCTGELAKLVAAAVESGELRPVDPQAVAMQLVCLLEGQCLLLSAGTDLDRLPEAAEAGTRMLIDGLRPEAPGGPPGIGS